MKNIYLFTATVAILMAFSLASCSNQSESFYEDDTVGDSLVFISSEDIIIDNIMHRRSIRQFSADTISSANIEKILKAGFAAPTAMNSQPWAVVVVNDKLLLTKMALQLPHARLETAAVAFVILGDMERSLDGDGRNFWVVDCSLMAENMMLAANAMGIGSCFTGGWPSKERPSVIRELLSIPSRYEILGMIPMGYPAENPEVKDKWRAEAVHFNAW